MKHATPLVRYNGQTARRFARTHECECMCFTIKNRIPNLLPRLVLVQIVNIYQLVYLRTTWQTATERFPDQRTFALQLDVIYAYAVRVPSHTLCEPPPEVAIRVGDVHIKRAKFLVVTLLSLY